MAATTPTGSRTTRELPTCSSNGNSAASCAYSAKLDCGSPAWIRLAIFSGVPTSALMVRAISSARAFSPSWMRDRQAARCAGAVADQPSRASRAAATARSTSAGDAGGNTRDDLLSGRAVDIEESIGRRGHPPAADVELVAKLHGVAFFCAGFQDARGSWPRCCGGLDKCSGFCPTRANPRPLEALRQPRRATLPPQAPSGRVRSKPRIASRRNSGTAADLRVAGSALT